MKKLLLFFIFIILTICDAAAQSKDTLIIIIDKKFKKSHVISCNDKSLAVIINNNTWINRYYITEWGTDSFKVLYKQDMRLPKVIRIEKNLAKLSKDTVYTIAYTDITGIRKDKRKGSIIDFIVFNSTLLVLVGAIVSGSPEAFIYVGVVSGLYALQAIIFPYEKTYRFDKKWRLVSIAGHHIN